VGASSVEEATLAAGYSTTAAGKSYSGSVEESGGEYEASVANMPGASASGSSIQSAENNLDIKIDTLA
jgi:predicted RNase H-like HicB family nuclease